MRFPNAVFNGPPVFRIELFEIGDGHGLRISRRMGGSMNHVSCLAHNAMRRGSPAFLSAGPPRLKLQLRKNKKGTYHFPNELH